VISDTSQAVTGFFNSVCPVLYPVPVSLLLQCFLFYLLGWPAPSPHLASKLFRWTSADGGTLRWLLSTGKYLMANELHPVDIF